METGVAVSGRMTGVSGALCAALWTVAATQGDPVPSGRGAPVPVEAFAELPPFEGAQLSPDGSHFAAKTAIKGKQYLVISPIHAGGKTAAVPASKDVDINWWRWVGNDWLAVGVGAKQMLYGEEYYVTRILGMAADGHTAKRIDWDRSGLRADDLMWTADDGTPRIVFAKQTGIQSMEEVYPSVFEADLSTGRARRLVKGQANVWDWHADGKGQVRMGLRYDDARRRAMLLYRGTNDEPFRTIARADRRRDESIVLPLAFRRDGTAIATDDSEGFDALYEVSLPDLKLGRRLYAADGYDIDGIVPTAGGDDADGVRLVDRFQRTIWFNPAIRTLQDSADKAVAERRPRFVSWSRDRTKFFVKLGGPSQAGALYYWDTAYGSMQHFAWNNASLKGRKLSPVSTVRYQARDGTPIEAVLTLPRGREAKRLPLIVLPHGGPFARDAESWDWWTQYLAEIGYAVIQPNYRGSSGYGTVFAAKGEGEWGLKMQDDLNDAVAHLDRQGIADPRRVCMVGASYGGYAAMRAAQRDGALYRCAISYAGVSDLQAMQRYDSRFLFSKTRGDWLKKQAPDYRLVSPRFGAAGFSIPILIVHGKEDRRVPVKQSQMMDAALTAAGKPHEYIEQPLADHHFTRSEDRLEFLKAMKAFLDRHNPA